MRRKRSGNLLIGAGCLLLCGALALTAYNLLCERAADRFSDRTAEALEAVIPDRSSEAVSQAAEKTSSAASQAPEEAVSAAGVPSASSGSEGTTATVTQSVTIDGGTYIGILSIPALDLSLPVSSAWSYPLLRKSPCCYQGSVLTGDLIIAGHNYRSHFGSLKLLNIGDEVLFTDTDGYEYRYTVSGVETLGGKDVAGMNAGDWDLTLFTCTYGGAGRVVVRCRLAA